MNERLKFLFGRRSIRVFAPGEVGEDTVQEMLEAAMSFWPVTRLDWAAAGWGCIRARSGFAPCAASWVCLNG